MLCDVCDVGRTGHEECCVMCVMYIGRAGHEECCVMCVIVRWLSKIMGTVWTKAPNFFWRHFRL